MAETEEDIILEQLARVSLSDEEMDALSDFISFLDDEGQAILVALLKEDISWAKILADNIVEKGRAVSANDLKSWQQIEDAEDYALVHAELAS